MICVYDGQDALRTGHGLGVIHPEACTVTEETGGGYELSATLPVAAEWPLMQAGRVIRVQGAPHRLSGAAQDFRIYGVELAEDGLSIRVQARHVFYDGAMAFVLQPVTLEKAGVAAALDAMAEASDGAPYAMDVQAGDATYSGSIDLVNWANALLDPDAGIVRQARLRLERDGMTVRLRPAGGENSGLVLRWGRCLTGLGRSKMTDQVVTRLQPAGEDAEGNTVYLPETYIDSPRIDDYWAPLLSVWRVAGAKVGQKSRDAEGNTVEMTLEDVYTMLREAAQERLASGCDLPKEQTSLAYVDMSRVSWGEATYASAYVCLYDWVTIVHGTAGIQEQVQVTGYVWDVLRQAYTSLEVGDAFRDRTDTAIVTAPQLRKESSAAQARSLRAEDLINIAADEILMQAREIELIAYDYEDLDKRTSQAEIRLDGMDGQITALGTDISDQGNVISQVLLDLNAAEAAIVLKAERTDLDALSGRVSSAEIELDAVEAEVALRATKDDVTAEFKVQSDLISANAAAIELKADKIDLVGFVTVDDLEAEVLAVLSNAEIMGSLTISGNLWVEGNFHADSISVGTTIYGDLEAESVLIGGDAAATQAWTTSNFFTRTYCNANFATHTWTTTNFPLKSDLDSYLLKSGLTTATTKVCTGTQYTTATTPPFYNANGTQVSGGVTYVKSVTYNTTDLTYLVYA